MNSEEKQALIARIEELKKQQSIPLQDSSPVYQQDLKIWEIALAALEAEPIAWVVPAPQGDYIERNAAVVAHLEGTGLAKCRPLYTAAPVPTIPDGWQLVPVEPTEEMLQCGTIFMDGLSHLGDAYEAMLSAVPKP